MSCIDYVPLVVQKIFPKIVGGSPQSCDRMTARFKRSFLLFYLKCWLPCFWFSFSLSNIVFIFFFEIQNETEKEMTRFLYFSKKNTIISFDCL